MSFFRSVLPMLSAVLLFTPPVSADNSTQNNTSQIDKPLFVLVYDQNCHAWCEKVRPIVKDLKGQYGDRVEFCELDTTQAALAEAKRVAKDLKIIKYVADLQDHTPMVAFFDMRRRLTKELVGPKTVDEYKRQIEVILEKK